jgi:hypothetical protein
MAKTNHFNIEFDDTTRFTCVETIEVVGDNGTGGWTCTGAINDIDIELRIVNAAPTRVFQVLNTLWEAEL